MQLSCFKAKSSAGHITGFGCSQLAQWSAERSARNASGKIPKLLVKRQVNYSLWKVNLVLSGFTLLEDAVELF